MLLREKLAEVENDPVVVESTVTQLEDWARSLRDLALAEPKPD